MKSFTIVSLSLMLVFTNQTFVVNNNSKQSTDNDSLYMIEVLDNSLYLKLDSIIFYEKNNCNYYHDSLPFYIHCERVNYYRGQLKIKEKEFITISASDYLYKELNYIGYFIYSGHSFALIGKNFNQSLFRLKSEKNKVFLKESEIFMEDDKFSSWQYSYDGSALIFEGFYPCC